MVFKTFAMPGMASIRPNGIHREVTLFPTGLSSSSRFSTPRSRAGYRSVCREEFQDCVSTVSLGGGFCEKLAGRATSISVIAWHARYQAPLTVRMVASSPSMTGSSPNRDNRPATSIGRGSDSVKGSLIGSMSSSMQPGAHSYPAAMFVRGGSEARDVPI